MKFFLMTKIPQSTVCLFSHYNNNIIDSSPPAFTLESVIAALLPHASKWQSLGEALSLDEDRLDEIYTNNETDEICLQEMLEVYMMRPNLSHSWGEIQNALKKIGGELTKGIYCKLLNSFSDKYVEPLHLKPLK